LRYHDCSELGRAEEYQETFCWNCQFAGQGLSLGLRKQNRLKSAFLKCREFIYFIARILSFRHGARETDFSFPNRPDRLCGPPSLQFNENRISLPMVNCIHVRHSFPSNAQIKNGWSFTSAPLKLHHDARMDDFTFTLFQNTTQTTSRYEDFL
jgi:hypothetical protein